MSHLKVFGLNAYIHVPDQLRKKINDNGEQIKLVGYHSTGGYKLYKTFNKRVIISRDIIFDDLKNWKYVVFDYSSHGIIPVMFENA